MAPFSADLDAPDQIAFRNDADQPCVDIDDRERAYAVTDHRIGRDLNRDIGANRDNPTNHHVPRLHVGLPCSGQKVYHARRLIAAPGGMSSRVKSVALFNRRLPVNFRYAPLDPMQARRTQSATVLGTNPPPA
jgi:hypothetical protein